MFNKNRKAVGTANRYISGMRNIALTSAFTSSMDKDSIETRGGKRNLGTILNFTMTDGINDKVDKNNFRKWTGLPETTRANKIAVKKLSTRPDKVVAEHRKMTMLEPLEASKFKTIDTSNNTSKMSSISGKGEQLGKNIPMSARNKIRLMEMKQAERLQFNV